MFTRPAYDDLYRKATSRHFPSAKRGKKAGLLRNKAYKYHSWSLKRLSHRSKAHPPRSHAITPRHPTPPHATTPLLHPVPRHWNPNAVSLMQSTLISGFGFQPKVQVHYRATSGPLSAIPPLKERQCGRWSPQPRQTAARQRAKSRDYSVSAYLCMHQHGQLGKVRAYSLLRPNRPV
jgi:hypothetical protein